tara:strand:- start:211 stop:1398 length:1188 start_codon:yes stop_codon:yes gene_type:complete
MGKTTWIIIGVVLVILILIGSFILYNPDGPKLKKSDINASDIITPSEAYVLCDRESCPSESVYIRGEMSRSSTTYGLFTLSDEENTVFIDLRNSGLSLIDTILFHEDTNLQKDGIVEVRVKGNIRHDMGMCTNSGCVDMVLLSIEPEETEVIRNVGCKDPKSGKTSLESGDCFDTSYRKMSLEEAYSYFFSSTICSEKGRKPSGSFSYDEENNRWSFSISSSSRPGGCTESCYIYEDKVVYDRTCAVGASGTEINLEEKNVDLKPLSELYNECVERNSLELTPAEDAPVGTTRYDEYESPWVKNEEGLWEGVVGIYFSQYRHDEESKSAPIGTIQNETVNGYGWIWKKVSDIEWKGFKREQRNITSEEVDTFPGGVSYESEAIECDVYLKKTLFE